MTQACLQNVAVGAEAREWFVRMREPEISPEDLAAWEIWLRADPAHGDAFEQVAEIWDLALGVELKPAAHHEVRSDSYDGLVSVQRWRGRAGGRLRLVWGAGVAAAVCVAIAVSGWNAMVRPPQTLQIATARGEQRAASLPDGSNVVVGGLSRLDVSFDRRRRGVLLRTGEAQFRVAHDRSRPFVVKTSLADISAVGTAFDVDVGSTAVTLTVNEGVVKVDRLAAQGVVGRPLSISAGQQLLMSAAGVWQVRAGGNGVGQPAWITGRFEYRNQPLALVIDDVNRYAEHPLRLADPSLGQLAYTGTVQLGNIANWIRGVSAAFSLDAKISQSGSIILTQKKSSDPFPARAPRASQL